MCGQCHHSINTGILTCLILLLLLCASLSVLVPASDPLVLFAASNPVTMRLDRLGSNWSFQLALPKHPNSAYFRTLQEACGRLQAMNRQAWGTRESNLKGEIFWIAVAHVPSPSRDMHTDQWPSKLSIEVAGQSGQQWSADCSSQDLSAIVSTSHI